MLILMNLLVTNLTQIQELVLTDLLIKNYQLRIPHLTCLTASAFDLGLESDVGVALEGVVGGLVETDIGEGNDVFAAHVPVEVGNTYSEMDILKLCIFQNPKTPKPQFNSIEFITI